MYWANKEQRNLAWWIEEAVENLSRRNPEISMDRDFVKICREKEKKGLDKGEFVDDGEFVNDFSEAVELEERRFLKEGKNT